MGEDESTTSVREEIVSVATAVLDRSLHPVIAVRRLAPLRFLVGTQSSVGFDCIVAIESDTDSYPIGSVRARCAATYLDEADAKLGVYLSEAMPDLEAACRSLIAAYR